MTQRLVALIFAISVLRPPVADAAARFLDFVDVAGAPRLNSPTESVATPDGAYLSTTRRASSPSPIESPRRRR